MGYLRALIGGRLVSHKEMSQGLSYAKTRSGFIAIRNKLWRVHGCHEAVRAGVRNVEHWPQHALEMHHFPCLKVILFAALSLIGADATLVQRGQCSETLSNANEIANELQSKYWNGTSGSYTRGELWTDANTLEDLHNLMLATGSNTYRTIAENSYIGRAALNPSTNWTLFLGGSYDDAQWVILALWKIVDYKASRGLDTKSYMSSSLAIYDMVAAGWDGTCGGGVWWSSALTYKNAITNELFLLTSAEAYLRTRNDTYLENALKEYQWLLKSGMQGSGGLFNDGLDLATCQNNGATAWTYNQAVVASGLGALYVAEGGSNKTFLQQAQVSLDATISGSLTRENILKESCDDANSGGSLCNKDQQLFKGLWMKHVQYFLDSANDASITNKYTDFLGSQYAAVYHNALNVVKDVGSVWYAPNKGGSVWGPQASASGLEAVLSAAKYAPCASVY
ncbi:glycoside hydrolase family 76 protein [Boletus coccyginus]|nr:glycoside hydrolase family 76 protein [Boletus coccyginus]